MVRIEAMAGGGALGRHEQAHLVVVVQRPHRQPGRLRELADLPQPVFAGPHARNAKPSRRVRFKGAANFLAALGLACAPLRSRAHPKPSAWVAAGGSPIRVSAADTPATMAGGPQTNAFLPVGSAGAWRRRALVDAPALAPATATATAAAVLAHHIAAIGARRIPAGRRGPSGAFGHDGDGHGHRHDEPQQAGRQAASERSMISFPTGREPAGWRRSTAVVSLLHPKLRRPPTARG